MIEFYLHIILIDLGESHLDILEKYVAVDECQFKAYRPKLFENLRNHCKMSEKSYLESMRPEKLDAILSDSKSGSL